MRSGLKNKGGERGSFHYLRLLHKVIDDLCLPLLDVHGDGDRALAWRSKGMRTREGDGDRFFSRSRSSLPSCPCVSSKKSEKARKERALLNTVL